MTELAKKTIVVLGGGFGGLAAALRLAKKLERYRLEERYRLLLVDKNDFHTYLPMLYLAASVPENTACREKVMRSIAIPFKVIIDNLPIEFCKAVVEKVDFERKDLYTSTGSIIHADSLIVSTGSAPNYFGMESVARYSTPLKSFSDARSISEKVFGLVGGVDSRRHIRTVVAGGGPTGVEVAAEIARTCQATCLQKKVSVCTSHVTLITGDKPVLDHFGEGMSKKAERRLKNIGVQIITGDKVASASSTQVVLDSGVSVPYDVFIWAGGVRQTELLARSKLKKNEKNKRILVNEYLEASSFGDEFEAELVYVLGDGASSAPMLARAAISQGSLAADNLISQLRADEGLIDSPKKKKFKPWRSYPYVTPVGGCYALAQFGKIIIPGFLGWTVKFFIKLTYLLSILPLWQALPRWVSGVYLCMQKKKA